MSDSISCHWFVLASLYIYFSDNSETSDVKIITGWSILLILSAMVHPYMNFMVLVLAIAFSFSHFGTDMRTKLRPFLLSIIIYPLELLLIFLIIGPLGASGLSYGENGFGDYSMNLNSFWNPMGFSAFLKDLPVGPKQYEGFNYLGLGAILLLSIATIRFIITCREVKFNREQIYFFMPLVVALTGFLMLAVSNKISYGGSSITLFSIPQFLDMPFGVFRASGRFGWPIYYVILYAGLYMLASQMTRKYTISILSICLIFQIADLKPLLSQTLHSSPETIAVAS